jgi:HEAT repeat protein
LAVRLKAVKTLVKYPSRLACKSLLISLRDSNAEVRYWAIFALEPFLDDSKLEQEVLQLFHDPSRLVRMAALKVLGRKPRKITFEPIMELLADAEEDIRLLASWSLSQFPQEYFTRILNELDSSQWLRKYHIFRAVVLAGQKAVRALRNETRRNNHSKEKLYWLVRLIGELRLREQCNFLCKHLTQTKDEEIQLAILEALARLGQQNTVPYILQFLNHPVEKLREASVTALGALGEYAVSYLLEKLDDETRVIRFSSSEVLARIGDISLGPLLESFYKKDKEGRFWILNALRKLALPVSLSIFRSLCFDEDIDIQLLSIGALADFAWEEESLEVLLELLDHENWKIRHGAAKSLARMKDVPERFFVQQLQEGTSNRRYWIIKAMEEQSRAAFVPILVSVFDNSEWFLRAAASDALQKFPDKDPEIFLPLLEKKDDNLLYWATRSLIGEKNKVFIDPVIRCLISSQAGIRDNAVQILVTMGKTAIPRLSHVFSESHPRSVYLAISEIMALMGNEARESVGELIRSQNREENYWGSRIAGGIGEPILADVHGLLEHNDWKMRSNALQAVRKIRSVESVSYLLDLLEDEYLSIRRMAVVCLGEISDKSSLPYLLKLAQSDDLELRLAVLEALGKIGGEQTVEIFIQALKDESWVIRKFAMKALCFRSEPSLVQPLLDFYGELSPDLTEDYLDTIASFKSPEFRPLLLQMLNHDDTVILQKALFALSFVALPEDLPGMKKFLDHEDWAIRKEAVILIGKLQNREAIPELKERLNTADPVLKIHIREAMRNILGDEVWNRLLAEFVQNSRQEQAEKFYLMSQNYAREKKWPKAVSALSKALALCEKPKYYHLIARAYAESRNYVQAEKMFLKILRNSPDDIKTLYNLAMLYFVQDKADRAENIFVKLETREDLPVEVLQKIQQVRKKIAEK